MYSQEDFEALYKVRDRQRGSPTQGQYFTFGRRAAQLMEAPSNDELTFYIRTLDLIQRFVTLSHSDKIIIVGGGFGFLEEVMRDAGFVNLCTLDNSQWIADNFVDEADSRVVFVNQDFLGDVSGLGQFDAVITEDILSGMNYADRQIVYANCDLLTSRTIHIVSDPDNVPSGSPVNDMRISEYKAEYPSHTFLGRTTLTEG